MSNFIIEANVRQCSDTYSPFRQLKQGDGGSVSLAEEGDSWIIQSDPSNANQRSILASSLGMLQVITPLLPIFEKPCSHEPKLQGEVQLTLDNALSNSSFPWVFEAQSDGSFTITVSREFLPDKPKFPAGGLLYLIFDGADVKWQFSGGPSTHIPHNATWLLVDASEPKDTLWKNYTMNTHTKQSPGKVAEGDDGNIILADDGDVFRFKTIKTDDDSEQIRAIFAPSRTSSEELRPVAPIFDEANPTATTGEVKVDLDVEDNYFPWTLSDENYGAHTLAVDTSRIPDFMTFPSAGKLFMVPEGTDVKWRWVEGSDAEGPAWVLTQVED